MAVFSLIVAFISAMIESLFSGFPGLLPAFLFLVLMLVNCECMAANICEEDKNSMLFMAIVSSTLVVLLCVVTFSTNLNSYLCEIGVQDPDRVNAAVPLLTVVLIILVYRWFLSRAKQNRLAVQKFGASLKASMDRRLYNPKLSRFRRMMIEEGILTERMPDEE